MKALITILILAALASAQAWGPAGVPLDWRGLGLTWMEASKFTSAGATNYLSMTSSAAADTLVWTQTGTPGDKDMVLAFVDESGNKRMIRWDDGSGWWEVTGILYTTTELYSQIVAAAVAVRTPTYTGRGGGDNVLIDPNRSGDGTTTIGETGDKDILHVNSRLQNTVTTVDSTYVMGAADGYMFTMTANDTLKCPTVPLAGEVLEAKFTNAAGGLLFGNGNTIDGASEIAASENDNIRIVWNATASDWEIR